MADVQGKRENSFESTIDRANDPQTLDKFGGNPLQSDIPEVRKKAFDEQVQMTPQPDGGAIKALRKASDMGNEQYSEAVKARVAKALEKHPNEKYTDIRITMPPKPKVNLEEVEQEELEPATKAENNFPKKRENLLKKLITAFGLLK